MIAMLSETSILIIAVVLVVLFGGSQLPKLARNVGTAGKEFRKAQSEAEAEATAKEAQEAATATVPPAITPPPVVAPVAPAPLATAAPADDRISVSKTELEALLDEREARARNQPTAN